MGGAGRCLSYAAGRLPTRMGEETMPKKDVKQERVKVRKREPTPHLGVQVIDDAPDVYVIVTQLYCPNGHNLVDQAGNRFDGFGGIQLLVDDGSIEGVVELSPFHGDSTKFGPQFARGTRLSIRCPECKAELPQLAKCSCAGEGKLRKLFLTPQLEDDNLVAVCDVWGCPLSRVIDGNEILSEILEGRIHEPG